MHQLFKEDTGRELIRRAGQDTVSLIYTIKDTLNVGGLHCVTSKMVRDCAFENLEFYIPYIVATEEEAVEIYRASTENKCDIEQTREKIVKAVDRIKADNISIEREEIEIIEALTSDDQVLKKIIFINNKWFTDKDYRRHMVWFVVEHVDDVRQLDIAIEDDNNKSESTKMEAFNYIKNNYESIFLVI